MPLGLTYNSQNWREDNVNGAIWNLGEDVGLGYGWKLQAGSLTKYYLDSVTIDHWEFQDSTGATYRLDQNNGGVWSSKESAYVWYDAAAQKLYFRNGTFWTFNCVSSATEPDAGTYYPTTIEDANGNQVTIQYYAGVGMSGNNSSSRPLYIYDAVAPNYSYSFTFLPASGSDPAGMPPHLWWVNDWTSGSSVRLYSLTYAPLSTLYSPFSGSQSFDSVHMLSSFADTLTAESTSFTYDSAGAGELLQVTFPYGGHIRWVYGNETLADNRTVREVTNRYLQWDSTIGERSYNFGRASDDSTRFVPQYRTVSDVQGQAGKKWVFSQAADSTQGLITDYYEDSLPSWTALRQTDYIWAQDTTGNNYLSRVANVSDPGQSYAVTKQVDQTLDPYGNVIQTKLYGFSDLVNPAKTYTNTYLTTSTYTSRYLFDRLVSSTVTDGSNTLTLVTNTYDATALTDTPGISRHDSAYGTTATYRGNVTKAVSFGHTQNATYDITGTVIQDDGNAGHYVNVTTDSTTNFVAPAAITTGNSLTTTMAWSAALDPTSTTGRMETLPAPLTIRPPGPRKRFHPMAQPPRSPTAPLLRR